MLKTKKGKRLRTHQESEKFRLKRQVNQQNKQWIAARKAQN